MKGESFFEAFGKINEKYAKSAESRFYISERREKAQNAAKIIGTVVSVAAVIAIILAIWIPSVIFRDPPISPIDSDTIRNYETESRAETDTDIETETVITSEESETEPATDAELPEGPDEDWKQTAAKQEFDRCVRMDSVRDISYILRDLCNTARISESADYCLHVYFGDYGTRRKALASWLFTYIAGECEHNDAYRDIMYTADLGGSDDELIKLLPACSECAKAKAKNYTKDEMCEYFPYTYKLLEKLGFDGYETEPDIASRAKDALIAASELWHTVTLGSRPNGFVSVTELPDDRFECDESDLYAYYGKYLPLDFVKSYIKSSGSVEIKNGRITFIPLDYQTRDQYVDYKNKRVISQSGDTAVIGVNVAFRSSFGDIYEKEMTFEIKEDKTGVHITGGTFVDKVMRLVENSVPYDAVPEYVIYEAISMYMYYYEGRAEYSYANSFADDWWISEEMSEEILNSLTRIGAVYDGKTVHPENAKRRLGFAFEHGYDSIGDYGARYRVDLHYHDVLLAMNIIDPSADHFVCSLDFTLAENGITTPMTYTFKCKVVYSEKRKYPIYVLTGGTFFEELTKFEGFDDPKTFMQSVFDAMRLPGTGDEAYYMSRPESCGAPQELVDIAKKHFDERAAQQLYYSYNGISDVSYFRNKARAFFAEDTLRELYDKNEKAFVKIDKTLYVNGDLEDIGFLEVTEISRCEKVGENKYAIDLAVMNCGELNPRNMYFTARLQIVSGRPVIAGGTFLDFIFSEMLVN